MMLGREVLLPLDLMYGPPPGEPELFSCPTLYTQWLIRTLRKAHQTARLNNEQALRTQKKYYDIGKKDMDLQPGVWVYWRLDVKKSKFAPTFGGPWCVTDRLSDVTFRIRPYDNGPSKVIHIDKLKICNGSHPANFVVPPLREIPTQIELILTPREDPLGPAIPRVTLPILDPTPLTQTLKPK
jgi:hypothetical protein